MVARYNGAYAKRQVGFEFCLGSGLRRQDADAEADLAMATNGTETHTHIQTLAQQSHTAICSYKLHFSTHSRGTVM